ncbi:MAG: hypothetical protein ABSA12_09485 [Verrucomicrobiia bacterium]|jgi:hypothetical protein
MKLACNIDQRGKRARLVGGVIVGLCGVALLVTGLFAHFSGMIIAGVFLGVTGSFMIFEGARGWCALRAIGIKTPM